MRIKFEADDCEFTGIRAIILINLLDYFKNNKDKWKTIKNLTLMINNKMIYSNYGRDTTNITEIRQLYLVELQQLKDIQKNYGIIITSARGVMMTNDQALINEYIKLQQQRAIAIFMRIKPIVEHQKRTELDGIYGGSDINKFITLIESIEVDDEERGKNLFFDKYWEDEWSKEHDHFQELDDLWDDDIEIREEWIAKAKVIK